MKKIFLFLFTIFSLLFITSSVVYAGCSFSGCSAGACSSEGGGCSRATSCSGGTLWNDITCNYRPDICPSDRPNWCVICQYCCSGPCQYCDPDYPNCPTPTPTPTLTPTPTPTPTPTSCPNPPPPTLNSPADGANYMVGDYVLLIINAISQKCGGNNPEYQISFTFRGTEYNRVWGTGLSWNTGPYNFAGTATWWSQARYLDSPYSLWRYSANSTSRIYNILAPTSTPTPTPTSTPTPTPMPPLCSVASVSASDGTFSDRINISWSANNSSQADRFDIYEDGSYLTFVTTSTFSYTRSGLPCGVTHTYSVYCNWGGTTYGGRSDVGNTAPCPTPTPIPPTPTSTPTPIPTSTPTPVPTSTPTPTPTSCPTQNPAWVSASDGTYTDRVEISWAAVSGASGYKLYRDEVYCTNTGGTSLVDDSGTAVCGAVTPGVIYTYRVKVIFASCPDSPGTTDTGYASVPSTPTPTPTPIPTSTPTPIPTATAIPTSTPTPTPALTRCPAWKFSAEVLRPDGKYNQALTWENVPNEEGYKIYRCEGAACSISLNPPADYLVTNVGANVTSFVDTNNNNGFDPGTWKYEIRPFAISTPTLDCTDLISTIVSPTPTPIPTVTPTPIPTATAIPTSTPTPTPTSCPTQNPAWVSASDGTYTDRVEISWAAVSGASGYKLYRDEVYCTNTGGTSLVDDSGTAVCGAVTPGVIYTYRVKTIFASCPDSPGTTDTGYASVPPTPTPTPIPTSTPTPTPTPTPALTCPAVLTTAIERPDGNFNVNLTWNDIQYEEAYKIYRCTGAGCTPVSYTSVGANTTEYTDTNGGSGFTQGTTVRYQVNPWRASDGTKICSTYTIVIPTLTPTPTPIPPTPTSTSTPVPTSTPTLTPTPPLCSVASVSASDGTFSDRINISWSANNSSQADRLDIYEDGSYLTSVTTSTSFYTRSGLSCGVTHTYTVYCYKNGTTYGGRSDVGSTAPCPTPTPTPTCSLSDPSQPQLVSPSDLERLTADSVVLTWHAVASWGEDCLPGSNNRYKVYFTSNAASAVDGDLSNEGGNLVCNVDGNTDENTFYCTQTGILP